MQITEAWANRVWPPLVVDAGVGLDRTQLIVVRGARPQGGAEAAYCPPTFDRPLDSPGVYSGIRRIGNRAYKRHHIIVIFEDLPDRDETSVEALLRHELEHAAQWEQSRAVTDELDVVLKQVIGGEGAYHETPIERAADAAARAWIRRERGDHDADRLAAAAFPHWQQVPEDAAGLDLHASTIAMLRQRAPIGFLVDMPGGAAAISIEDFIGLHNDPEQPLRAAPRQGEPQIEFVA